jgi:PAS domain S-box-containing protein
MKLRLSHQGLMLVSGVLLFELVLVAIFAGLLGRSDQALESSYLDASVISHIDKTRDLLVDMELSASQPDGQAQFQADQNALNYEFNAMHLLLRDDRLMQDELEKLKTRVHEHVALLHPDRVNRQFSYKEFQQFQGSLLTFLDKLVAHYKRPTEFIMDRAAIQRRMTEGNVLVVILINAVVAVGTVLYFVQGIVNRLSVVADNSVRFGRGEELNPPLSGADEIATLDQILHITLKERSLIEKLLKESEARTRSLIENMPVGVVTIEESGTIESINPRTEKIFGYSFDELFGDHLTALFNLPPEMTREQFTLMIQQKVLGKTATFESRRKSGEVFPIEMELTEFDSIDGKRYLAIIQDITERAKAEQFKQELIAMVSHDLRSPLTSVQGVITLLGRGMYGQLNDTGDKRVRSAEQSISRLIHLIDDMLDLERMEAGRLQFNCETVALSSIIDRSIELVYDFAQQSQIHFDVPAHAHNLYVDEDRMIQVLVNLLANAIKFSPKGSTITISAQSVEPDQVEVCVSDKGPGIAPEYLEFIFDRFAQVEGGSPTHKGTGLGLAICRAIIEGHEGSIGVHSQVGQGASFWVRLPSSSTPRSDVVNLATERKTGPLAV